MGTKTKPAQVKIYAAPEVASAFKEKCTSLDVSMSAALAQYMADSVKGSAKLKGVPDYSTRRHRRAAIKGIIGQLEQLKAWEEQVRDNTPENFQGTDAYDATEEAISSLEEAIDALESFW